MKILMNLNDLKREHNRLQKKGRKQYAKLIKKTERINALREEIKKIEGDDYDPIPLIFGGDFNIYEDGEHVPLPSSEKASAPKVA